MPIAIILYLASYIDRANIGNARVLGLYKDLQLTSNQYNLALSIFFFGYVIYETPSNILLKKISPRFYIPAMAVIWGVLCTLFAVVHNSAGLVALRFWLGFAEAGCLPGIIYWIGCWYPRSMQGRKFALLYCTVSLTGAFGGLLATAIHSLDGAHGIAGWRWIFIVEGVITCGIGLIAFMIMSAYPVTAHWLKGSQREIVLLTNEADRALKAKESFSRAQIRSAFTDWRTYCWSLMFLGTYIPVYSVVLSLPSVVTGLGYSGTTATLMACPPYGMGFIVILLCGWSVDRYGHRFLHYSGGIVVAMIALIVLMIVDNLVVRYIMFFFIMFMFVPIAVMWAWLSSNVAGSNKRAAASGFIFSIGNIGGAISGQIYRAEWAPRYVQGHAINLACFVLALAAGTVLWWSYRRDNEKRNAAADGKLEHENMLGEDLGDLGDRHPHFRYYL
ncbi:MFS general substrate transporter [Panus rudis PR-1116 ss-1]|nr:MFS general substrate transporter [Panus rudis PR-1116 ss-1]